MDPVPKKNTNEKNRQHRAPFAANYSRVLELPHTHSSVTAQTSPLPSCVDFESSANSPRRLLSPSGPSRTHSNHPRTKSLA